MDVHHASSNDRGPRLIAPLELLLHVLGDLVEGHVARALVHHLNVLLPRTAGQLALGEKLGELGSVVRICARGVRESAG